MKCATKIHSVIKMKLKMFPYILCLLVRIWSTQVTLPMRPRLAVRSSL